MVIDGKFLQSENINHVMPLILFGSVIDDRFVIYIPQNIAHKEALIKKNEEKLSLFASEVCGKKVKIEVVVGEKPNKNTQDAPNDMLKAAMDLFS